DVIRDGKRGIKYKKRPFHPPISFLITESDNSPLSHQSTSPQPLPPLSSLFIPFPTIFSTFTKMKFFSTIVSALLLVPVMVTASPITERATPAIFARQSSCTAPTGKCSFYNDCIEKKVKCGNDGYALDYGKVYCDK